MVDYNEFMVLDNQDHIDVLFNVLCQERKGITIFLGSTKKFFKTFITRISLIQGSRQFETDYISFLNLYRNKFQTEKLAVVFSAGGLYYGFEGEFVQFIKRNQLMLELPNKLYKLQRRRFVRVKQSPTMPIDIQLAPYYKGEIPEHYRPFINFWRDQKDILQVSMADISEGGIGILLKTDHKEVEKFALPFFRARLFLSGMILELIAKAVSMVYNGQRGQYAHYRVGLKFLTSSREDRAVIKKYIMERQTEMLRIRKDRESSGQDDLFI